MDNQRDHTNRMGRVMPYTDGAGAVHPESFWVLSKLTIDIENSTALLVFIGYNSIESYNVGRTPIASALRQYEVAQAQWMPVMFAPTQFPTGSPLAAEVVTQCWGIALRAKEVGDPPQMVLVDDAWVMGDDNRVSFFAESVPAPVPQPVSEDEVDEEPAPVTATQVDQ